VEEGHSREFATIKTIRFSVSGYPHWTPVFNAVAVKLAVNPAATVTVVSRQQAPGQASLMGYRDDQIRGVMRDDKENE
jgi:hypothetical protein